MNKNRSKIVVYALIGLLSLSLVFNVIQATTPATGPYYLSIPTSEWAYEVGQFDNGSYYMINGSDWHVDYQSTNATTVIQYAINNLTVGRTMKETIVLKGDLGLVGNITVANYTSIIGVDAKLSLNPSCLAIFLEPSSILTDISIKNIHFYTPGGGIGIFFFCYTGSTWLTAFNVIIEECSFDNFYEGIFTTSQALVISKCVFHNNTYGISLQAGGQTTISNNNFVLSLADESHNSTGLYIIDTNYVTAIGNHFTGALSLTGYEYGVELESAYFTSFLDNTFDLLNAAGISLDAYVHSNPSYSISIIGNVFSAIGGIHYDNGAITMGWGQKVTDVIIEGNVATICQNLFQVVNTACNVSVIGNTLNVGYHGFSLYGSLYTVTLYSNVFKGCSDVPVLGTGTLKAKDNLGFVTENSVSGANTTSTTAVINHGLAAAATYVWCSFNNTAVLSYTWTSTATQITVTVTGTLPASWKVYAKVEYVP